MSDMICLICGGINMPIAKKIVVDEIYKFEQNPANKVSEPTTISQINDLVGKLTIPESMYCKCKIGGV